MASFALAFGALKLGLWSRNREISSNSGSAFSAAGLSAVYGVAASGVSGAGSVEASSPAENFALADSSSVAATGGSAAPLPPLPRFRAPARPRFGPHPQHALRRNLRSADSSAPFSSGACSTLSLAAFFSLASAADRLIGRISRRNPRDLQDRAHSSPEHPMMDIISGLILKAPPPAAPSGGSVLASVALHAVNGRMISASLSSISTRTARGPVTPKPAAR